MTGIKKQTTESGFTLVEVVVALAILSISTSVVFGLISNAIRQSGNAEKMLEASEIAQSLLAQAGVEFPLRVGKSEGKTVSGLRWELRIGPYGDASDRQHWPISAYQISAQVSWSGSNPIVLTTIRTTPKDVP